MGKEGSGKSSVRERFVSGTFSDCTLSTIGAEMGIVPFKSDVGVTASIQVLDVSPKWNKLSDTCLQRTDAIVFVYDVTDPASFSWIEDHIETTLRDRPERCKVFLMGNKTDLLQDSSVPTFRHKVVDLAINHDATAVYVSAKTNFNVREFFKSILRDVTTDRILLDNNKINLNHQLVTSE